MKLAKKKLGLLFSVLFVSLFTSGYYKAVQIMGLHGSSRPQTTGCSFGPDVAYADVSIPYVPDASGGGEGGGGEGGCG